MRTREAITVSLPPDLLSEVARVAEKEGRNRRQVVRDALVRYLSDRKWQVYRGEMTRRARALGIYTEDDVERVVDEVRK